MRFADTNEGQISVDGDRSIRENFISFFSIRGFFKFEGIALVGVLLAKNGR